MPLKSTKQEKFLWATKPALAQKFEDHTSKAQKSHLPAHVADKRKKPIKASPKTQVGRDHKAFCDKRTEANRKGWAKRKGC